MSEKVYGVSAEWAKRAWIDEARYQEMYARSIKDPDGFWAEHGKRIDWFKPFTKVREHLVRPQRLDQMVRGRRDQRRLELHRPPSAQRGDQIAIIWEGDDPGRSRSTSPTPSCTSEVCRFANVLQAHGVKKGDRVTIYLPMIPEAAYAMLACARIGAIHSVVFGGFSPDALAGRIEDCEVRRRHHRRRRPARRPQGAAEGQCRRGDRKVRPASST